eukprot:TRINITY_DN11938_c2_g1_i1.p1 TRINITY_DN11938_c2_g1~~TRINITY_DN11938_c2_g1_i1.p1  ORF type:complete len:310 (+),score=80.99 TRINITY_DN11938_c2_g1_i1:154-1083(+)
MTDARAFLASCKLSQFERPSKLVTVDLDDSLLQVIETLSKHNILCAPVKNDNGYTGVVDLGQLLNRMLDKFEHHAAKDDDLTGMAHLVAVKSLDQESLLDSKLGYNQEIEIFDENTNLLTACKTLGTMNTHRILVGDDGALVNFITQSAVVRLLAQNIEKFPASAKLTLADCHLNTPSDMITVDRSTTAIDTFKLMRDKGVGAVPIVSDGALIGNLSVRDVRSVLTNKRSFKALHKSVTEYIACNAPDQERSEMFPAITCKATATLGGLLSKLAVSRIHRVYIVDPEGKPVRAVTLSDILAALVTPNAD